ncbi:efflux RND transporter periplasmic adaptor subunit [Iodobacter sp. LRB]|uniref:efflux RND transporter periplasmic adaptor subunit n=1 Tax=unclassified Iodobacter TaxID=235634 RepID=UPI001C556F82|nr:efflux RND transporter periplasmic adaptor subunit [Iodobacter sp. BJB302]
MRILKQHPKLTAICAGLVLCGVIALIAMPKSIAKATEATRPAMTVTVVSPAKQTWPVVVNANGNIEAWQESVIGAEIGGYALAEVQAQIGDVVKRGQVLAQFSSDTLKIELAQQQAALAEAEAAWNEATDNAGRIRKLDSNGALSSQQIQQSVLQEQAAAARLQAAKARLAAQQLRIKQSQVSAPDDGVISARSATVGAVVQPGQELFRLIRQSRLEWRAEVSAVDAARIKNGQQVSITLPNGQSVNGKVRKAAPTVDARTRNLLVYVDLQNTSLDTAKPGMFAKGALQTGQGDVLTLPGNSIVMRDGFAHVFVLGAGNKVKMQRVTLGRQDSQSMAVSGVGKDAQIIASGAGFLADGDVVKVVAAK